MHPFREGLLENRSIALAGPVAGAVRELLMELGARLHELDPEHPPRPLDALVCAARRDPGQELLEAVWTAVRAAATEAFIPAKAGRLVLLAPRDGGGEIEAALENLARTLSVEWARYGITTTAIVAAPKTTDDELAAVIAYLCSPAGAYFSGCRFDMG
jgi:NAD(P)-dependent dehydrogenase (short-subunit alcohol dehydrogenase family)